MTNAIVDFREYARQDAIFKRFEEVIGERNARSYISSVALAVANSQQLQRCTPSSLISAALQAASLSLSCDPQMRQAYLVPFKNKAVLVVGYKGLYDMAIRTGRYRFIQVSEIYEGERVEFDRLTGAASIEGAKQSDKVVGWQGTFVMFEGLSKTIYMSVEEIHAHAKQYSAGYNRHDSAWKTNTREMEKKTVLRRLLTKWAYLDPNDAAVLNEIEEHEFLERDADDVEMWADGEYVDAVAENVPAEELVAEITGEQPAPANGKPQAETKTPAARKNGASKSGNPLQVWVDEGIAENLHNAAEIATLLGGTNIDEARRYRRWRQETDASPKVAAEHAKAGNEPS